MKIVWRRGTAAAVAGLILNSGVVWIAWAGQEKSQRGESPQMDELGQRLWDKYIVPGIGVIRVPPGIPVVYRPGARWNFGPVDPRIPPRGPVPQEQPVPIGDPGRDRDKFNPYIWWPPGKPLPPLPDLPRHGPPSEIPQCAGNSNVCYSDLLASFPGPSALEVAKMGTISLFAAGLFALFRGEAMATTKVIAVPSGLESQIPPFPLRLPREVREVLAEDLERTDNDISPEEWWKEKNDGDRGEFVSWPYWFVVHRYAQAWAGYETANSRREPLGQRVAEIYLQHEWMRSLREREGNKLGPSLRVLFGSLLEEDSVLPAADGSLTPDKRELQTSKRMAAVRKMGETHFREVMEENQIPIPTGRAQFCSKGLGWDCELFDPRL
ncbi:MAG TPA: hypothetical protein VI895_04390 [Bdellovibrionota bacterium]|nr:hypothetical protein [Bdellovibrionota bacterium]